MSFAARAVVAAAGILLVANCTRSSSDGGGLPPASDWSPPTPAMATVQPMAAVGQSAVATPPTDPHAGLDVPPANPGGSNPHAGLSGSDGTASADPNRQIDPSKYLRGSIVAGEGIPAEIPPGAVIFLSVRPVDRNTGDPSNQLLAVDKLVATALPVEFTLTEAHAMASGVGFEGAVEISARVDGDGEASSKQPGDLTGSVQAVIPSEGLVLTLDTRLQ